MLQKGLMLEGRGMFQWGVFVRQGVVYVFDVRGKFESQCVSWEVRV